MLNLAEIQALIKTLDNSSIEKFEYECDEYRLSLKKGSSIVAVKKAQAEPIVEEEVADAEEKELKNELITLFYSSFGVYEDCPHKYSLGYNYNFKLSDTENITFGNVVHETLDNLHSKSRESKITKEELSKIIDNTFESPLMMHWWGI